MRCKLSLPLTIDEVVEYTHAVNTGNMPSDRIKAICTDTRELLSGDLFIALNSEKDSGEKYIDVATGLGIPSLSTTRKPGTLYVESTTEALLNLANGYIKRLNQLKQIIAVTGSVGKTTTKNMLHTIFSRSFATHSTPGNFNNLIGVPLTVLSMPKSTQVLICECGMNHRGEISRLSKCLNPTISVITNVGTSHIGMLGSYEQILKAKCEIADGMKAGYILHPYSIKVDSYGNTLSVSDNGVLADLRFEIISRNSTGTSFNYYGKNIILENARFALGGIHTFNCLTYAVAAADVVGIDAHRILSAVAEIREDTLRFKEYRLKDISIIDDSYNASYESISAALKMMESREKAFDVVIGDILELGEYAPVIHYEVGKAIARSGAKKAFLVGEYSDCVYTGARDGGMNEENIFVHRKTDNLDLLASNIIKMHTPGALLLLKASHKIGLSRLLTYFEGGI